MNNIVDKNLKGEFYLAKKLIVIVVVAIMLFGVVALTACTSEEDEIVKKGTFYTLLEAYHGGLLTVEDLQIIANYHNNGTEFIEIMNSSVAAAIKQTRVEKLRNLNSNPIPDATIDDVTIIKYYGKYSNAIAVVITDIYSVYGDGELVEFIVGGITFYNYSAPEILIWKQ